MCTAEGSESQKESKWKAGKKMTVGTTTADDGRDNGDTTAGAEEFITECVQITNITDCGW